MKAPTAQTRTMTITTKLIVLFIFTISQCLVLCHSKLHSPATITSNAAINEDEEEKHPLEVQLEFINKSEEPLNVYWVPDAEHNESDPVHVRVMEGLGSVHETTSYHGHTFEFKGIGGASAGKLLYLHVVDRAEGTIQKHEIEVKSEGERHPLEIQAQFVSRREEPMNVYWVPNDEHDENDPVHVGYMEGYGSVHKTTSYHGHIFLFKETDGGLAGKTLHEHVLEKSWGAIQKHEIEEKSQEL